MKRIALLLVASLMACTAFPVSPLRDGRGDLPLRYPTGDQPVSASLVGRVVDTSGVPVSGADVRVFPVDTAAEGSQLVSNNSGALTDALNLVSNNSGSLTGDPVKPFRSGRSIQTAATTVRTGLDGTFALSLPVGQYNVECAGREGTLKAWRPGVEIQGTGAKDLSNVMLRPTGSLEGRVRFESPLATNFLGAEVFVPGSSYLAKVREDGGYVLTGIPEGEFTLVGWHPEQGVGRLSKSVVVRSAEKTSVSEIVLTRETPMILGLQAEDGLPTDNGAPGTRLKLLGLNFGVSKDRPLSVTLKGQPVDEVIPDNDGSLRFTVPARAETGNLVVTVGGRSGAGLPFRVLKRLVPRYGLSPYQVVRMSRFTVSDLYEVYDTEEDQVIEVRLSGGQIHRYAPNVKLKLPQGEKLAMDGRSVLAVQEGIAVVQPDAGSLVAPSVQVEVVKALSATPVATVAPTIPPTAPPSAIPSQAPSVSPPVSPAPTLPPAPARSPQVAPSISPVPAASATPVVSAPGSGNLAPDDTGNPLEHHDYIKVKNGVASAFVWVPVFEAYQLIQPANCGLANIYFPVGFWVADRPTRGVQDVDWVKETFGGFYAGKFEASRSDARPGSPSDGSGATAGTSIMFKVAQNCVPWTNLSHDNASEACHLYDAACHLMEDDEWTALAVWSTIHGVTVYGNNDQGKDADDPGITFRADPTWDGYYQGRALTGSGVKSGWSGNTNLTTHTGTTVGVYDLNGNVSERTATLGSNNGQVLIKGVDTGISTGYGAIIDLSTDARLRRYGVPNGNGGPGNANLGFDWSTTYSAPALSCRGWTWMAGTRAGVWGLDMTVAGPTYSDDFRGFRPVLRY